MAEVSTLAYALLGLVAREPMTGYDLAQKLRMPVSFYWTARHSQIYPELTKLQAAGYLKHKLVRQSDRPDKKVFTITKTGREALRAWIDSPVRPHSTRDELMLKTYSIWLADRKPALAVFRRELERHDRLSARHEAALEIWDKDQGRRRRKWSDPNFGDYATLRRGIVYERGMIEWLRWMIDRLQEA